jgi:hypothetical protein
MRRKEEEKEEENADPKTPAENGLIGERQDAGKT